MVRTSAIMSDVMLVYASSAASFPPPNKPANAGWTAVLAAERRTIDDVRLVLLLVCAETPCAVVAWRRRGCRVRAAVTAISIFDEQKERERERERENECT